MTSATHKRQTKEANFRHDLIDIQNNSQAIALIRGEINEQERLLDSFRAVIGSYAEETSAWIRIQFFSAGYSVASMALPFLVAAPRYIAGAISLGMLIQSVQAFQHMVSALSWPVDNMAQIAKWRTSVERVLGLMNALDHLEQGISDSNLHQISVYKANVSALKFNNVRLEGLQGEKLASVINDEIKAGEHVPPRRAPTVVFIDSTRTKHSRTGLQAGFSPESLPKQVRNPRSAVVFFPPSEKMRATCRRFAWA